MSKVSRKLHNDSLPILAKFLNPFFAQILRLFHPFPPSIYSDKSLPRNENPLHLLTSYFLKIGPNKALAAHTYIHSKQTHTSSRTITEVKQR